MYNQPASLSALFDAFSAVPVLKMAWFQPVYHSTLDAANLDNETITFREPRRIKRPYSHTRAPDHSFPNHRSDLVTSAP